MTHRPVLSLSKPKGPWILALVVSLLLLVVDILLVETGPLESADKAMWADYANGLGSHGFRLVEGFTLVGVIGHSSRLLAVCTVFSTLATAGLFVLRRRPSLGALCLAAVAGAAAATQVLKATIVRSGPTLTPWTPDGKSFPSGTIAVAVAFLGLLGYIAFLHTRWRVWAIGFCMALIMLIAASSLTYHYATEVVGGICVGVVWLSALVILFWDQVQAEPHRDPIAACRPAVPVDESRCGSDS